MNITQFIHIVTPINFFVAGEYYGSADDRRAIRLIVTFCLFFIGFTVAFFFAIGTIYEFGKEFFISIQAKFWLDWWFRREKFKWSDVQLGNLALNMKRWKTTNSFRHRMYRKSANMILKYNNVKPK